jgi:hypothetical protein
MPKERETTTAELVLCGRKGMLRMMWIKMAEAVKWIAVSIAVSVAIYVTGNWKLLWFFLIPMLS